MSATSDNNLKEQLSQKTFFLGLKLWVVIGVGVGFFIIFILLLLVICVVVRNQRKLRRATRNTRPTTHSPPIFKEIKEVGIEQVLPPNNSKIRNAALLTIHDNKTKTTEKDSDKTIGRHVLDGYNSHSESFYPNDGDCSSQSGDDLGGVNLFKATMSTTNPIFAPSPLTGLPEFSHLGWGHWFTLRDLELATDRFSRDNVLGEGGYGVVYHGHLINEASVAVKKLLNNV